MLISIQEGGGETLHFQDRLNRPERHRTVVKGVHSLEPLGMEFWLYQRGPSTMFHDSRLFSEGVKGSIVWFSE